MELYFTADDSAQRDPEAILAALRRAELDPQAEHENELCVITLRGARVFIELQRRDDELAFATLDVPMNEDAVANAVFCVLLELGWTSEEDVG